MNAASRISSASAGDAKVLLPLLGALGVASGNITLPNIDLSGGAASNAAAQQRMMELQLQKEQSERNARTVRYVLIGVGIILLVALILYMRKR